MPSATLTPPADAAVDTSRPLRPVPRSLTVWRPDSLLRSWLATLAVVAVAAGTRFWALGFPHEKVFDEVYYATEAKEMLRYGYEDNRDYMFIVHPPLGKWCIALSSWLWGDKGVLWHTSPEFASRAASAVAGTVAVLITVRVAQRMLRSTVLGALAGLFLALDGISLVLSRVALLDIFLQVFILAGFAALVLDRDQVRGRLASLYAAGVDMTLGPPSLGPRPWRLVAGVMFGLGCAVKWSGWSFWIGFSILSLVWEYGALRAVGVDAPVFHSIRRGWPRGFFELGIAAIGAYLLTWTGWFVGENSWNRHWGETHPGTGLMRFLPAGMRALMNYHAGAYRFHTHLESPHAYEANPWSWLVLGRPISFYYPGSPTGCGAKSCAREILLIGTPIMYWAIVPMLLWMLWRWVTTRDWRAGSIIMATVVGWAIWLLWQQRTAFLFYMAPVMPYLMIGLAMAVGAMLSRTPEDERSPLLAPSGRVLRAEAARAEASERLEEPESGPHSTGATESAEARAAAGESGTEAGTGDSAGSPDDDLDAPVREVGLIEWIRIQGIPRSRLIRTIAVALWMGAVVADFVWMWPIFTGGLLTYDQWHLRMWFPSWI